MKKIYAPSLAFLFFSCGTSIQYIGQTFPSTKNIEVFISEKSIKFPFEYIGKGYITGYSYFRGPEKIMKKARAKGLEKGADAVLISDYYIPNTGGTSINSIYKTDSIGKGTITVGNTTIRPTSTSGYNILYLKYIR